MNIRVVSSWPVNDYNIGPRPPIAGLLPAPRTVHVVSVGGGLSSTLFLVRECIQKYGKENCVFIYAYLPNEHPDMLDLVFAVERLYDIDVQFIGKRLTPMEVGRLNRFIPNHRADVCSKQLKRVETLAWVTKHCDPAHTVIHVGITYDEPSQIDRMVAIRGNWNSQGWQVVADLQDKPEYTHEYMMEECQRLIVWTPEMYRKGFSHHNCHGACVKAGKAQWARLLWTYPAVYAAWETDERLMRAELGDYTILKGTTLEALRLKLEEKRRNMLPGFDLFDGLEETRPCVFCEAA